MKMKNDNCRIGFGFNVKEVWEIKILERHYDNTGNETSDIKQKIIPCTAQKKLISTWPTSGDCQSNSKKTKTNTYKYPNG